MWNDIVGCHLQHLISADLVPDVLVIQAFLATEEHHGYCFEVSATAARAQNIEVHQWYMANSKAKLHIVSGVTQMLYKD
ncbi:hypothetical protein SBOR_6454 [Sclerotinia borealis F-4128]|uniref:Uncharacterized protein n=1 Tax=Sclerotinia borealis (strain F-4128) TaxID=1432307 RepID=W9CF45_SCLBF|nr:hypothetical protein SBOR_6454 [Sclerotinia borealis F-4128]